MQAVHYPKLLGRLGRIITHMALLDSGQFDSALGFQAAASEAASGAKEPATTAPLKSLGPPYSAFDVHGLGERIAGYQSFRTCPLR